MADLIPPLVDMKILGKVGGETGGGRGASDGFQTEIVVM